MCDDAYVGVWWIRASLGVREKVQGRFIQKYRAGIPGILYPTGNPRISLTYPLTLFGKMDVTLQWCVSQSSANQKSHILNSALNMQKFAFRACSSECLLPKLLSLVEKQV